MLIGILVSDEVEGRNIKCTQEWHGPQLLVSQKRQASSQALHPQLNAMTLTI